jgi:hypothetical protein
MLPVLGNLEGGEMGEKERGREREEGEDEVSRNSQHGERERERERESMRAYTCVHAGGSEQECAGLNACTRE